MTGGGLSEHQRQALDRYYVLLKNYPELFSDRLRRPIIREPAVLEAFAEAHHIVLGVAAETPYLWLINDLVRSRDSNSTALIHPYLRIIAPPQATAGPGVVVLATLQTDETESIVLVEQERHATGTMELELPRGFGRSAVSPDVQALRELQEETGYVGQRAECMGSTLTDSGTTDRSVSFFHVPITGRTAETPETQEAISRIVLLPKHELWVRIDSGTVRDAFTVQALALYERRQEAKRTSNLETPDVG